MNKTIYKIAAAALVLGGLSACSEEQLAVEGEGHVKISATLNSDVTVVSRAQSEDELAESCTVWLSNDKGVVREYHGLSEIPAGGIDLYSGHYKAEAWAGTKSAASWEDRWFEGVEEFDVRKGETTTVDLSCKIQNTIVSVVYEESADEVISNYTLTAATTAGELTFEGKDERKGYFIMPEGETTLKYTLSGKLSTGEDYTRSATIENVKPSTEYRLTVRHTGENDELGGAYLTIVVDESEVVVEDTILITVAPDIKGYNFDIDQPLRGKSGEFGRKSVYITGAAALSSVVLEGDILQQKLGIDGSDFDLMNYEDAVRDAVIAGGITNVYSYDSDQDISNMKINFEETFTNSLPDGEYGIRITASDALGNSSVKTLTLVVSADPVTTADINLMDVYATTAVLRANVSGDAEEFGFNYRKAGDSEWTYVSGKADGNAYTAALSGLSPETEYEYVAATPEFASSKVVKFTTEGAPQLPNSSFEDSYLDGKVLRFYKEGDAMFWDSGNKGSSTLNVNITTLSSDYRHSGETSVRLGSQKVAIAFAAGNLFVGEFLGTESLTKGILGWGRPFSARPKALKAWVKYTPAVINDYNGGDLQKGSMDEGIIYMALLDNSTETYGNYGPWPCMIATKQPKLFDPKGSNVIAYGEKIFSGATDGDGLVEVTIPLDYIRNDIKPSNIVLTASASRCGDYYTGGASVMYIDDIELVY
ncbi:MAG: DUF4493 domain-containing protein [Muribaculaceae bacterium]|nr:DUF4493 domain-containing protein [Muribaculaceae bacterium]